MSHTPTSDPASVAQAQELAQALYDTLMARIEPDLTMAAIATLDAKYANETPEKTAARMKRYEAAYEAFDSEFASCMEQVRTQVHEEQRKQHTDDENADKQQESAAVSTLENAFQ